MRRCSFAAACVFAVACSGSEGPGTSGSGGVGGSSAGSGSPGNGGTAATAGTTGTSGGQGGGAGQSSSGSGGGPSGGTGGPAGAGGSGQAGSAVAGAGGGAAGGRGGGAGRGGAGGGAAGASGGTGGTAGNVGSGGNGATTGTAGSGRGGAGGAAGGVGGATGTGGSANPATPTKVSGANRYRFSFGEVVLEIDAQTGGRVSTLSLAGTNIIMPAATDPTTWGSVFWTSPRSDWTPVTWPPPPIIDNGPYTGSISGSHVVVNGPTDTAIGVGMAKDYSADASSGWMTITYTINAAKAIKAAPWEVSRVPRGGITFFPAGSSLSRGPLTVTQSAGIVWFDDAPKTATSPDGAKLFADGSGGWTAYVLGGNLFLKKFADQPASAQAAGEGEIDVYPGNGFLEFEVQGPYTSIAASGSLPWTIQWRVVKVPSSVTVAVGSSSLVDFVRQQLAP